MTKMYSALTLLGVFLVSLAAQSQSLALKKGVVQDSLKIHDSIPDTYALFLPQSFELKDKWPLLMVYDMKGRAKKEMTKFLQVADYHNYVLAAPNSIHDSLSLTENMLRTKRLADHLINLLPINRSRIYTGGMENGGRFANLVPIFLKDIEGTIAVNAAIANIELLNAKNPFHYIGVVDKTNFSYPTLLKDEKMLNGLKFPNNVLVGSPSSEDVQSRMLQGLSYFELQAMARGQIPKDSVVIEAFYQNDMQRIDTLLAKSQYLEADRAMLETLSAFRTVRNTDALRSQRKELKRRKEFRSQKREEEAAIFKETLLREDFAYYLEEDVLTYNFNNLGWWNYQKAQLDKYKTGNTVAEQQMGHRLDGYINALVADNIDLVNNQKTVDEEALVFLYMLKTIIEPSNFEHYLKVISIASKNQDYGTALFYLEEALKNGFDSKDDLYSIPNTGLLRVTPEFNALIKKYLNKARYNITDE